MTLRELGPGTIAVLFGNGLGAAAAFGVRWLMARYLTPAEVGVAMLALAVCLVSAGVASLGLQTAASHRLATLRATGREREARAGARTALLLAAAAGALATGAVVLGAGALERWLEEPGLASALRRASANAAVLAPGAALYGVARAFDDLTGRVLLRDGLGNLWRLIGVAAACAIAPSVPAVLLGYTAGAVLGEGGFAAFALARGWCSKPAPRWDRDLVAALPPYAGLAVLFQAAQWFDLVLLGAFAPAAVVGVYSIARGVARILDMLGDTASQQYLASASTAHSRGGAAALQRVFVSTRALMVCLLLPVVALLLAEPHFLLGWVFGPDYAAGGAVLRVLVAAVGVSALAGYPDKGLVAIGRAGLATACMVAAVVTGVAVLLATAPRFGALGAALGWAAFAVVQALGGSILLWRRAGVSPFSPELWTVAFLGAGPTLAAWGLGRLLALGPWPSMVLVAAVAAAGSALILRRIDRSARSAAPGPVAVG